MNAHAELFRLALPDADREGVRAVLRLTNSYHRFAGALVEKTLHLARIVSDNQIERAVRV